jgi:fatty acid desaturase
MSQAKSHDPDAEVKQQIRARLTTAALRRHQTKALLIIPYVSGLVATSLYLALSGLSWPLATLLALGLGVTYSSFFFFGHEISHGAIVRSRRLQLILSYAPFLIVCLSPRLWRVWHNRAHHAYANIEDADPDCWGVLSKYEPTRANNFIYRLTPGSNHWLSLFYLPCFFSLHTQIILWVKSRQHSFGHLPLRAPATETVLIMLFWIAVCVAVGGRALYVVLIPMVVTNTIIMSYIATNHMLRPMSEDGDSLATTMSVRTLRVLDFIHLNFSHHVEHHLFPAMDTRYAPLVREALMAIAPDRYLAPPHWLAVLMLFRTPRLFDGTEAFVDPLTGKCVPLAPVEELLRDNSAALRRRSRTRERCHGPAN